MKILYVASDNSNKSGAFLCMIELCQGMREKYGIQTKVILPFSGPGTKLLDDRKIEYEVVRSFDWVYLKGTTKGIRYYAEVIAKIILNIIAILKIYRIIRKDKFDIVHINTSYTYVGAIAAKLAKIPYVWHIREFGEEDQGNVFYFPKIVYSLMNDAKIVICISESIKKKYSQHLFKEKLKVIYDGVECERFFCKNKKILAKDIYTFLIVGTIKETKGQCLLLKACGKLLEEVTNFKLIISGTGLESELKRLKEIIHYYRLEEKVEFLGFISDIEEIHRKADILFMCSSSEAFGRVTVEGMLSGSLIIGGNQGCTKEIIRHGGNGLLYRTGDSDSLKDTIKFAIMDPDKSRIIARQGQLDALKYYTLNVNIENINSIYEEINKVDDIL